MSDEVSDESQRVFAAHALVLSVVETLIASRVIDPEHLRRAVEGWSRFAKDKSTMSVAVESLDAAAVYIQNLASAAANSGASDGND